MSKKILAILSIIVIMAVAALSGCSETPRKITATIAPAVPTVEETMTPTPTPMPTPDASHPRVVASGGTITIRGNKGGVTNSVVLGVGVYAVTWSGSGTYLNLSLNDFQGNGATDMSKGHTGGKRLLAVDDIKVYSGNFTLKAASDSDWTVTIEKQYASSAASLPVTVSGSEEDGAVTAPFKAYGGPIKISYSLSQVAQGDGYVNIYDISTGQLFPARPITKDSQVGQSMSLNDVPGDTVYIAQVDIPAGSKYGSITISQ